MLYLDFNIIFNQLVNTKFEVFSTFINDFNEKCLKCCIEIILDTPYLRCNNDLLIECLNFNLNYSSFILLKKFRLLMNRKTSNQLKKYFIELTEYFFLDQIEALPNSISYMYKIMPLPIITYWTKIDYKKKPFFLVLIQNASNYILLRSIKGYNISNILNNLNSQNVFENFFVNNVNCDYSEVIITHPVNLKFIRPKNHYSDKKFTLIRPSWFDPFISCLLYINPVCKTKKSISSTLNFNLRFDSLRSLSFHRGFLTCGDCKLKHFRDLQIGSTLIINGLVKSIVNFPSLIFEIEDVTGETGFFICEPSHLKYSEISNKRNVLSILAESIKFSEKCRNYHFRSEAKLDKIWAKIIHIICYT